MSETLTCERRAGIERECAALVLRLAWLVDHDQAMEAVDLFAPDAVMDRNGERHAGIDAIAQAMRTRPRNRMTRHVLSNLAIEVESPVRAHGQCYVTVFRHRSETGPLVLPVAMAGPETLGEYRDTFVNDGSRWLFGSRTVRTILDAVTAP